MSIVCAPCHDSDPVETTTLLQAHTMASKAPIPQNDNVAHALAGAGGGILSMVLTYEPLPLVHVAAHLHPLDTL